MPKCDFNKAALQLYRNRTSTWVFSCKFAAYFKNTFLHRNTYGGLLLILANYIPGNKKLMKGSSDKITLPTDSKSPLF